jgi:subtilisin family serine protease
MTCHAEGYRETMRAPATILLALLLAVSAITDALPARASVDVVFAVNTSGAEVLVRFVSTAAVAPSPSPEIEVLLSATGVTGVAQPLGPPDTYLLRADPDTNSSEVAARLEMSPLVLYAEPSYAIALPVAVGGFLAEDAPAYSDGWPIVQIGADHAWHFSNGRDVVVAVLDSGVSASHPALAGRVLPGWDFVHNAPHSGDDNGHGTFVASLIAGGRNHAVDSVAPGALVMPVKILDQDGMGSTASFAAGIHYAVEQGARVINISAGGVMNSQALRDSITYAEANGATVIAAAGHDGEGMIQYPAAYPEVIGVGATDLRDHVLSVSATGPHVSLVAPGWNVRGAWWDSALGDTWKTASGTSAAAAVVSGSAALLLGAKPDMSPREARQILTASALPLGDALIEPASGYGRVNAGAAVHVARELDAVSDGWAEVDPLIQQLSAGAGVFSANEPVIVWSRDASGVVVVKHGLMSTEDGHLVANLLPAWRYAPGTVEVTMVGVHSLAAARATLEIRAIPLHPAFQPIDPFPSSDVSRYFAATGHSVSFGFKHYWESHGGLARFGYPISEEFFELNPDTGKAHTVQYFERARFEYHPEFAGTRFEVSLGRLGDQMGDGPYPQPNPESLDGATVTLFAQAGHTLSGEFLEYWTANGGLFSFGYPLSEPFTHQGLVVQVFERVRFEYHPDNPPEHRVLLVRLGLDLARQNGYLGHL